MNFFAKNISISIGFLLCHACFAQEDQQPLRPGMTFNEVVKIKGAPIEKDEHEVSRIILWKYKGDTLKFYEGKLQVSSPNHGMRPMLPPEAELPKPIEKVATVKKVKPKSEKPEMEQKAVDELIDALPNEGTKGTSISGGASSAPAAAQPFVASPEE